jgi:hypothetical protein
MIKEDYVSFEVAKLLKEKGFDENTPVNYFVGDDKPRGCAVGEMIYHKRAEEDTHLISCPTIQMAMKWLREVHRLHCNIGYDNVNWYWDVQTVRKPVTEDTAPKMLPAIATIGLAYNTYEEACEAAIKCCLEDLI